MAGKRQPTDVVIANGRKHLSKVEEAERRAGEVKVSPAKTAKPPKWLPETLKKDFRAIGKRLIAAGLYTELDADTLGRYLVAHTSGSLPPARRKKPWPSETKKAPTAGARFRSAISNRPGTVPMTWA